eukprot:155883_1
MPWALLIIPIILYGLLIWWWGHKSTHDVSLSFWELYLFKILLFFYQITPSINELFADSISTDHLAWIEYLFNFYFPVFENIANLNILFVPIICVILLTIFYTLDKIGCCNLKTKCHSSIANVVMNFYFTPAFITFYIYVYATIIRISFQLLNHTKFTLLPGWYVLVILEAIVVCVCPFGLVFALFNIRKNKRKDSSWLDLLTLGYKGNAWWYGPYRMFCKLLVIIFASVPLDKEYKIVLIRSALFGFLVGGIWVLPFKKQKYKAELTFDVNKLEIICLIILCLLSMLVDYDPENTRQVYTILKYIPAFIIICLVAWKCILHIKKPSRLTYQYILPEKCDDAFFSPKDTQFNKRHHPLTEHQDSIDSIDSDDQFDEEELKNENQGELILLPQDSTSDEEISDVENDDYKSQLNQFEEHLRLRNQTTLPTKSRSMDNMGPKDDTEVDKMLQSLGKQFEQYANGFTTEGFNTYEDIVNNANKQKLKIIVKNVDHRSTIVDKAKEMLK